MQILSVLARKTKTFIKIENRTKVDFIKAYIYTGIARGFILFVPFNKLSKRMGKQKTESVEDVDINTYRMAKRIGWIVIKASKMTPWQSKCLVQALTAQRMLKSKGVPTTIYLGVKKGKDNTMLAHAWVRCGRYVITGGANKNEYTVVARFSNNKV